MENLTDRLQKFEIERDELREKLKDMKSQLKPTQSRLLQVGKNIENIKTKIRQSKWSN